jgi:hypothetical protein
MPQGPCTIQACRWDQPVLAALVLLATPGQLVSPDVGADRRVTLRLRAPRASQVLVQRLFFQDRLPWYSLSG